MKLLHALRRPRWLVVIGCAAVLAPAAVLVSGVAATDDVVTSQATPLVDRDYIYGQLFDMAYNDVYRVSGADGPPTDPSSPGTSRPRSTAGRSSSSTGSTSSPTRR